MEFAVLVLNDDFRGSDGSDVVGVDLVFGVGVCDVGLDTGYFEGDCSGLLVGSGLVVVTAQDERRSCGGCEDESDG